MKKISIFFTITFFILLLIIIIFFLKFIKIDKDIIVRTKNNINILNDLYFNSTENINLNEYFVFNIDDRIIFSKYINYNQNAKNNISSHITIGSDKFIRYKENLTTDQLFELYNIYRNDITNDSIKISFTFKKDLGIEQKIIIHNKINNKENCIIKNIVIFFIYEKNIIFLVLFNIILLFLLFLFYDDLIKNRGKYGNIDKIFNTILCGNFYYRVFSILFLFIAILGIIFIIIFSVVKIYILDKKIFINIGAILILLFLSTFLRKKENKKKIIKNNEDNFLLSDEYCEITKDESNYKYINILNNIINTLPNDQYFSIALNGLWGSGKTSILKTFKEKILDKNKNIYCRWISLWEFQKSEDVIIEIENQFKKIIYDDLITINKKHISFFKIVTGLYNSNISNLFDIFNDQTLEDSKTDLQKKLTKALERKGIDKIIIIFDDLDRILDREEVLNYTKIIKYLVSFDNIISISAVDIEKVVNLIKEKSVKSEEKYQPSYYYDFVYKIFNSVIDLNDSQNQSELVNYLREQLTGEKSQFLKFLEKHLKEESNEIMTRIINLVDNGEIYGVFNSYREIKLTINEIFIKLLSMKNPKMKLKIIDIIDPQIIFFFSALKNINLEFYHSLVGDISEIINNNSRFYPLEYLKQKFYVEKIQRYEEIQGIDKEKEKYLLNDKVLRRIVKIFKFFGVDLYNNSDKSRIFNNRTAFKFYLYPNLEIYQISKTIFDEHFKSLLNKTETIVIKEFFESRINDKFKKDEILSFLNEYLEKYYDSLVKEKNIKIVVTLYVTIIYFSLEFIKNRFDCFKYNVQAFLDKIFSEHNYPRIFVSQNIKKQIFEKLNENNNFFGLIIDLIKINFDYYVAIEESFFGRFNIFHVENIEDIESYFSFMDNFFKVSDNSIEYISLYFRYLKKLITYHSETKTEKIEIILNRIDLVIDKINYKTYNNKDKELLLSHLIEIMLYPFLDYSKNKKELVLIINKSKLFTLILNIYEIYDIEFTQIARLFFYSLHAIKISYLYNEKINIKYFEQLIKIKEQKQRDFSFSEPFLLVNLFLPDEKLNKYNENDDIIKHDEKLKFLETYPLRNKQIKTLDDIKEVFEQYKKDFPEE